MQDLKYNGHIENINVCSDESENSKKQQVNFLNLLINIPFRMPVSTYVVCKHMNIWFLD